jgi:hypothetical protein
MTGSGPTLDPGLRDPADVASTDSYRPADPVWVYRGGTWCAGVVEAASAMAATVTYRPTTARGTAVDTLTARYLLPRTEPDSMLDRDPAPGPRRALEPRRQA